VINNTFFIVARECEESYWKDNPYRDYWGWEVIDGEILDYIEAKRLMNEYQSTMRSFVVRIRAIPIDRTKGCY
jgi:hypothetical protein